MPEQRLRIASYNIRKAWGLDQRRDPQRTLSVINSLNADIVVLQEADKRFGQRPAALPHALIRKESDFAIAEVARNDVSLGWHGNAVLFRDGLKVDQVDHICLPGLEPRGAVSIKISGDISLTVVAVHLALRRRDRIKQLDVLERQNDPETATVFAGDFNAWARRMGNPAFESRFMTMAPGHSFHAGRPIAGLDRFATSRHIKITDAGVLETLLAQCASDHLPIWADVTI
ncbi:MAG: endonuclease/exonuclease/phosphatase family protein [Pseudomonadota bacterium]